MSPDRKKRILGSYLLPPGLHQPDYSRLRSYTPYLPFHNPPPSTKAACQCQHYAFVCAAAYFRNDPRAGWRTDSLVASASGRGSPFLLDSGATDRVVNDSSLFTTLTEAARLESVKVGDGRRLRIAGRGKVHFRSLMDLSSIELALEGAMFVPHMRINIVQYRNCWSRICN